jgi:hypothetical protein
LIAIEASAGRLNCIRDRMSQSGKVLSRIEERRAGCTLISKRENPASLFPKTVDLSRADAWENAAEQPRQ